MIVPASVDDLAEALTEVPEATIVAGMTDVGLWITKFMRDISPAIFMAHLEELRRIESDATGVTIGAGVSYDDFEATLAEAFPYLAEYWHRIGGWQVRAMGTIGGNIANGSPIGDTPPPLIALGATVTLRKGAERRTLPLEDFFIAYGKQDRAPGEFVESVHVPKPAPGTLNAAYKVTKRRDEDISAVAAGFHVALTDGVVTTARLAFGGMAATPKRAAQRRGGAARPALDAGDDCAGASRLRRGLRPDHRLARLGRLPGDGGEEPLATVLPGNRRRRRGAAGAEARGLMEQKLMEKPAFETEIRGGVHTELRHDSAHKHVTGLAEYTDDIIEPGGTLHAYLGLADKAHAEIVAMDLDAVRAAAGVVGVLTAADIPHNDVSPVGKHDDPVLAEGKVEFHGQPIFAVIAETRELARRAATLAKRRVPRAAARPSTWRTRLRPTIPASPSP